MHRSRRTTIAGIVAGTLLAGTSVAAYAATSDPVGGGADARPSVPQEVPAALAHDFGVFRRAVAPSESLARYVGPDSDYVTKLGLNPALARRVATDSGFVTKVWIAPTADGTCRFVLPADAVGPGGSCGSAMTAAPYASADSSTNLDGSIDVVGLTYDGVKDATIALDGGKTVTVPVLDNVYAAHLTSAPRGVRLTDPERGEQTVHVAGY